MVHKPQRLTDILYSMRISGIEPKSLKMVHAHITSEPSMVLIEGRKGAGAEIRVESPLIIYDSDGKYSREMHTEYGY